MLRRTALLGAIATTFVGGCSMQSVMQQSAEQQVKERAQARWDAARAGDFEKSYSFTAPSYRAVTDLKLFRAETAGSQSLVSATVISVTCESDTTCAAKARIEYYAPLGPQRPRPEIIENHFDEPWVKEDGNWWLFRR
jgi:hypothetical protein